MKLRALLIVVALFNITACMNTTYKTSNAKIQHTKQAIQQDIASYDATPPPVVMHRGYYVSTTPYQIDQAPKWMREPITLQAQGLPLGLLMHRILDGSDMTVSYDHSVSPNILVNIDYSGDVGGALKQISSLIHADYSVEDGNVNWSDFVTKTFNISFMPGVSDYLVGQAQSKQQFNPYNASGNVNHLNDRQYSNMSGRLSVWDDLERTLDQLKSQDGKVIVSESTTSVTVYDHPNNVRMMADYIAQLNKSLSQEVGIRVQVVEVALNHDYNFGINWNVVKNILKTQLSLTGNLGSASNLVATNLTNQSSNSPLSGFQIGKDGADNSNLLLNALSQEGNVRVVTKPQVVTMNDQIASIRITQDTGYIQSVTSSQFEQYQTTTLTPGTITDGFTLYLLPKIQGEDVYMQISSRVASLLSLQKVSNEPDNVEQSDTSKSNTQFSAIEVPTIASKEFNQRSVVKSGSTLIIAGYKRLRDQTSNAKMFGISALGGRGAQSQNVETLVLITPVIMKGTT